MLDGSCLPELAGTLDEAQASLYLPLSHPRLPILGGRSDCGDSNVWDWQDDLGFLNDRRHPYQHCG